MLKENEPTAETIFKINERVHFRDSMVTLFLTGDVRKDYLVTDAVEHNSTATYYKIEPVFAGNRVTSFLGVEYINGHAFDETLLALDEAILLSGNPNYMGRIGAAAVFLERVRKKSFLKSQRDEEERSVGIIRLHISTPASLRVKKLIDDNTTEANRLLQVIWKDEVNAAEARRILERAWIVAALSGKDFKNPLYKGPFLHEQALNMAYDVLNPSRSGSHLRHGVRDVPAVRAGP